MLVTIRTKHEAPAADALGQMLACHERIRRFLGLARRLGDAASLPPQEAATAAAAVLRYFHEALPLHAADEDQSLRPRLLARGVPTEVDDALRRMTEEHLRIEELLVQAKPLWGALAEDPARRDVLRGALAATAQTLQAQFDVHLVAEEMLLFPTAQRVLLPQDMESLALELRQRRSPR